MGTGISLLIKHYTVLLTVVRAFDALQEGTVFRRKAFFSIVCKNASSIPWHRRQNLSIFDFFGTE